jgi:hypothetical protein
LENNYNLNITEKGNTIDKLNIMLAEKQKELELEKKEMINLKSEMQIKDIQKEEMQVSLDKAQSKLDKLNGYKYLKKFTDTSYMSTYINDYEKEKKLTDPSYTSAFNDYDNLMNRVDDEINEFFKTTTKYDEKPRQLKQLNQEDDYTHENRAIPPFIIEKEDRRRVKEERRKEIGRRLALESGIRENEYLEFDDSFVKL